MKVICDIKLSKSQREAWEMVNSPKSKKAYFTFAWSRQSGKTTSRTAAKEFKRIDSIIDQIYCDICNGLTRDDIISKVVNRMYEGQKGKPKKNTAVDYYCAAIRRIQGNMDEIDKNLAATLYTRYEMLFNESLKTGDLRLSRDILNDVSRIFGPERDKTLTVKADTNEKVLRISFGFSDDTKNENNIEEGEFEEINDEEK